MQVLLRWLVSVVLAVVDDGQRRLLGGRDRSVSPGAPNFDDFNGKLTYSR